MSRSRFTFFTAFLLTLLTGAGLFYALPALAQVDFAAFGEAAGFSTDLDIRLMIARLIRTVISFIGIVLVVLILYGGFVWMTAAGSAERVEKAKKILTNAIIGIVIVIASFAITSFILGALSDAVGGGVSGTGEGTGPGSYPDNGSTSAFVLNSINTECASALKNLELQMIFSKTVKEDTVLAGGIRVRSAGGGPDVPGTFKVSLRKVTFVPEQVCPEDANEHCFDPLTNYTVALDPAILKSGSGTGLTCSTQYPCSFAFTTGENIDVSGPLVEVSAPESGQSLMINSVELLQAWTQDDTGVSSVEFSVDRELIFDAGLTNSTAGALTSENYFQTDNTQWNTAGYITNKTYSIQVRGFDCSGRSDLSSLTAILRSENCFNGIVDSDFGETDVDCGGSSSNEFYCGACVGDQCAVNEDCASGVCENGFCVGATIIQQVSPGDGAPGNLVTIFGRGFGAEPGSVTFLGTADPNDDVVISSPYFCQGADTWTDTQIVIQLEEGIVDGPILVQTLTLEEDYTNDSQGPYIPDFDLNDIVRPGLCSLAPPLSPANQEIRFLGNNFSAERGSSTAYFGTYAAASYTDWSDNEFGAVAPLITPGRYQTQVFVGDNACSVSGSLCLYDSDCPEGETCLIGRQGSNRLNFQLLSTQTVAEPVISFIDTGWQACDGGDRVNLHCANDTECPNGGTCLATANWGPSGQYVSIFGSDFGNFVGTVRFINNLGASVNNGIEALGSDDFSPACEDIVYWRDNFIIIKVPEDYLNNSPLEAGSHLLYVKRQEGLTSNQVEFYVVDDQPGPAICALDPSAGPTGSDIDILGENFGSAGARAWFTPNLEAPGAQTSQTYSTQVPANAQTGNVYLANSAGYLSNQMPFTVGDCRDDADLCALGESCCGDGTCQLECPVTDIAANYAYRFFTGPVPIAPEVVQICDSAGLGIVSPTPWSGHTRSQDICKNAVVSASFRIGLDLNPQMDQTSFANNILVEKCLNTDCTSRETVPGSVIDTWGSGFVWLPAGPDGFAVNTRHFVTLNGYWPEEDVGAIQAADGEFLADDFVWDFTTANSEVECAVGDLMVTPGEYTAVTQDEKIKYLAQPVAAGDGGQCILLSCREYSDQYAWNSTDPVSAPLLPDTQTACGISAEARAETLVGDFVTISSAIANPPVAGSGELTIHFTDPKIVSYWPVCQEACVNAEIGARFNIDINDLFFSIERCDTEACLNTNEIFNYTQFFDHDTYTHRIWLDDLMAVNTYYRVTYYPNTASGSGHLLAASYGSGGFSWLFKTKDDPALCGVDRVEISPAESRMRYIGQMQGYTAVPYGSPDNCSANGQILNASGYTWRAWSATDNPNRVPTPAVVPDPTVVASLLGDGTLPLSSELADGCNSDCLHLGSAIQANTPVCGNNIVEYGEDCDDGNNLDNDGCSSTCLNEGTDAPLCGNGVLDLGEECDDGNTNSGDGCSARCLREGASAAGYTCGDRIVSFRPATAGTVGEECDDGNTRHGDGCSNQCLNEGSIPKINVYATCGNGVIEDGEDCDDGNLTPGDGCSEWCLAEGTNACVSLCTNIPGQNCTSDADCGDVPGACQVASTPCCGNGAIEVGENCDDGNTRNGDGCSRRCLLEGSSLNYGSVCGNGAPLEAGESCEAAGLLVTGPFAVAQVDEGAVEELLAAPKDVYLVSSEITGTVENTPTATVSGTANFSLACVCETDAQCGDSANFGCGLRQCCFKRPAAVAAWPTDSSSNVCRNTAIWFEFDQEMDPASVADGENFFIKLVDAAGRDVDQADCPEGYQFVAKTQDLPWYARAWHWIKNTVLSLFGQEAAAAVYQGCIVPDVSYSSEIVGNGSRLRIILNSLLNENSFYQVVALDDPDKTDGLPLGLLSKYSVGLKAGYVITFEVGNEICSLDEVVVEDLGKDPFDELRPSYELFTKSGEVHRLQGAGYAFRAGQFQEIQPIDNVYDWEWSWATGYVDDALSCPLDDPETPDIKEDENCLANAEKNVVQIIEQTTPEISPTAPDINPTQALVSSANQDGRENAYAIASIITDKKCVGGPNVGNACQDDAGCPDSVCLPAQTKGSLPLTVLLCANPWPDANFPYVQSDPSDTKGATNFSFYYCRDAGEEDTMADDLPALSIQEVAAPAVGEIYREFLFILEGKGDALGVRVMNNENYLPPDMWYEAMGFTGSPSADELDGYQAVREGNTIYASAANQTGDIFPNIYVVSTTNNPSPEAAAIFDQISDSWSFNANTDAVSDNNLCVNSSYEFLTDAKTGNFLPCTWDGDCPSNDPDNPNALGICDADKAKLTRDLRRLSDLVRVKSAIQGTCSISNQRCSGNENCPAGESCENLSVPALSEGSFIRAMSTSRWPSWNSILSNSLGQALPEDPLNVFSSCPGEPYDPESCFNATEGLFTCAAGSHIYGFNSSTQGAYVLTAQLEHDRAPWHEPLDPVLGDNADIVAEYQAYAGSGTLKSGFVSSAQFCSGTTYGDSSVCGDGIKAPNEICEINETIRLNCPGGQINADCISDNGVCRFQTVAEAEASGESCQVFGCGNGVVEVPEECDEGVLNGTYGHCGADCTTTPDYYCGDGYLAGGEQCDCGINFSSLPAGSWARSSGQCLVSNGQYSSDINRSCAFDCSTPGPSCGDGLVNGSEVCDPGNLEENYQEESCGTLDSEGREEFRHRSCTGACDWDAWSTCAALSSCGDGQINGNEECDDGNDNNYDACRNDCRLNICGDGYVNVGVESCDLGEDNGDICQAAYNSICYYCNESCQYQSRSGDFCGDNIINGNELCDGVSHKPVCFDGTTRTRGEICQTPGVFCGDSRTCLASGDCDTCRYVGICNGGPDNGLACTLTYSGGRYVPDAGGGNGAGCVAPGICIPPKCSDDCRTSCPFNFQSVSLQVQSETLGSLPSSEIELYSFLNPEGNTPDNALLFLPACRASTKITADINKSKVIPPSVDIVFVTDRSGSMSWDGGWRLDAVRQASIAAIDELLTVYGSINGIMRISLVSYSTDVGIDNPFSSDREELKTKMATLTAGGGTNTHLGIDQGLELLNSCQSGQDSTLCSDSDIKILILMTDGDPYNTDLMMRAARLESGAMKRPDVDIYTVTVNNNDSLFAQMRFVSNDICVDRFFTGPYTSVADCVPNGVTEYAFKSTEADGAAGVAQVYQQIVNAILGVRLGFVSEGQLITKELPEGTNQELPFPENMLCSPSGQNLPLRVDFEGEGTVKLSNFRFNYCPVE